MKKEDIIIVGESIWVVGNALRDDSPVISCGSDITVRREIVIVVQLPDPS